MRTSLLPSLIICATGLSGIRAHAEPPAALPIKDNFTQAELPVRKLARGPWQVKDGIVTCTQDDALYEKFKNHGPIMTYAVPFKDARIRFSVQPDAAVKAFVFTANGEEGHVFRFVSGPTATRAIAFPREGEPAGVLAADAPALKPGVWTDVTVELRGPKATLTIGDYTKTFEHPSLARPKINATVGFSFGSLKVKNVTIEP